MRDERVVHGGDDRRTIVGACARRCEQTHEDQDGCPTDHGVVILRDGHGKILVDSRGDARRHCAAPCSTSPASRSRCRSPLHSFASLLHRRPRPTQQRSAGATAASDAASGWDLALTGGFVATGLVDPVYALGSVAGQPIASRVASARPGEQRQPRNRDVRAGVPRPPRMGRAVVVRDRSARRLARHVLPGLGAALWIARVIHRRRGDRSGRHTAGRRGRGPAGDRHELPDRSRHPHHAVRGSPA